MFLSTCAVLSSQTIHHFNGARLGYASFMYSSHCAPNSVPGNYMALFFSKLRDKRAISSPEQGFGNYKNTWTSVTMIGRSGLWCDMILDEMGSRVDV
jgi:hypothetical protein